MMPAFNKTHYSAAELASMQLPGIPTSKGKALAKAIREGWKYVETKGVGGTRREFVPPAAVLDAIKTRAAQQLVASVPAQTLPAPLSQATVAHTEAQSLVGDARKGVLEALNAIMGSTGYPLKKAARHLLVLARQGEASPQLVAMLKLARDARGRQSPDGLPSERSLARFVDYNKGGALVPKKRAADMTVPAWAQPFMAFYQRPEKPTVEHAYRQFAAGYEGELPSIHQVRRFLDKVGAVALQTGRMGSRELKTIKKFIRRTFDKLLPSDIYSADGHCFDAEVQHPFHGRPFRPEITSVVDIATRRLIGWSVDLAESSLAVLDALRVSALTGGIPAVLYVDNGSGYVNQMMNDTATGLLARLGTEMVHSLPYNSQARGVIERLHKTIWVDAAKEVQGYIGRDMDRQAKQQVFKMSRQALTAKNGEAKATPLMAWHLFLEFCAEKAAAYNAKPHRSLPKMVDPVTGRRRWMSPDEAWALAEFNGFVAERITEEDARPLFRPQTTRTVRRCEIELFTNRYFNAALEEFHGDKLRVAYDLHDPQLIWVYADDGRLICTAELDANARDYMPQSFVEQARDKRAAGRQNRLEVKLEEVRAERSGTPALEIMERVTIQGGIDLLRQKWANERELELVPLDAFEAQQDWTPSAARAEPAPVEESNVIAIPETPQARFQKWLAIDQLLKEGGNLDDAKLNRWYGSYPQTSEHRSLYKRHLAMQEGHSTVAAVLSMTN
jgi:putative transposase